jgi:hypothetical protein
MRGDARGAAVPLRGEGWKRPTTLDTDRPSVTHRIVGAGFKPARATNLRHRTTGIFTNGQRADRPKAKPEE